MYSTDNSMFSESDGQHMPVILSAFFRRFLCVYFDCADINIVACVKNASLEIHDNYEAKCIVSNTCAQ